MSLKKNDKMMFSYFENQGSIYYTFNLSDPTQHISNEINKIKNCFTTKIQEIEIISKKLSKYITTLDYFDKTLIALSAISGGMSIVSFVSIIESPVGIASAIFGLLFSLTTGIIKKNIEIKWRNIIELLWQLQAN